MAILRIAKGAVTPESLDLTVTSDPDGLDLTTVTAAVYRVRLPSGQVVTWTATIISSVPGLLELTYPFQPGDVGTLGTHIYKVHLTVPAGTVRSSVDSFEVVDEFFL